MTVEEFRTELEAIVSCLGSSGFGTIDQGVLDKLVELSVSAGELGMAQSKHLIENLAGVMKSIQEGNSTSESAALRLTALEFQIKKFAGGNIEEL
jgi:hypothetical protein